MNRDSHAARAVVSAAVATSHCVAVTGSLERVVVEGVIVGGSGSVVPIGTAGLSSIPIGGFGGRYRVVG